MHLRIWERFGGYWSFGAGSVAAKTIPKRGVEAFIVQLLGNEIEKPGRQARAAMIQMQSRVESYEELRSDQVSVRGCESTSHKSVS